MKSKKKVLRHLASTPYTKKSALKIIGFLHGQHMIEIGEMVNFKSVEPEKGEIGKTFKDFVEWFEDEAEENEILTTLLEDLSEAQIDAMGEHDQATWDRVTKQIEYLFDALEFKMPEDEKHE